MAQTIRVTTRTVEQAELAHDVFEQAISDGHVCDSDIEVLRQRLDLMLVTASLADAEVNVGVSAIRGGVGTRHHRMLVADCARLESQASSLETMFEPLDAA